jgi:cyanophycinase
MSDASPGHLALVGGAEWTAGCSFDQRLWEAAGRPEVLVLPTAAAYEHPARAVATAQTWFATFGATAVGLDLVARPHAFDETLVARLKEARFIYLGGGSPMHMRSVLKDSPAWDALVGAWHSGAVIAGSSAGAMVLGESMVDPRGGALTLGLGLISGVAVLPHSDAWSEEKTHRTVQLATGHLRIAAVDEQTALIRDPSGKWSVEGAGQVSVFVDARPAGLEALAGV